MRQFKFSCKLREFCYFHNFIFVSFRCFSFYWRRIKLPLSICKNYEGSSFFFKFSLSVGLYLNFISLAKFYICFSDIKVCWFLSEFFILFKDICIRYAYQTGKSTIYLDYIPPSLLYICVRVCFRLMAVKYLPCQISTLHLS